MHFRRERFQLGIARILGISAAQLNQPGFVFASTVVRDAPEWANWVHPIWFFAQNDTVVCSASLSLTEEAKRIWRALQGRDLLNSEACQMAESVYQKGVEWVQCEFFCYLREHPPTYPKCHSVEAVEPGDPNADHLFRNFDGGVYAIRNSAGQIVSQATVKNKGIIHEIAVGTQPEYRRQGMGTAVVAHAVEQILAKGRVPTYWSDSLDNAGSYAIARAVGFEKVADMLFCCYAEPHWPGFFMDG